MRAADLTESLTELMSLSVRPATSFERTGAIAAGLPMPDQALCWSVGTSESAPLAYLVLLPGSEGDERRARAVAAADLADPAVTQAVASAREALITALNQQ